MDKKKLQQIMIILPVILIGGIFVYCKYVLFPLNDNIKRKKSELEEIKKKYEEASSKAARLPKLQQENIILKQEIEELKKVLPESKNLPGLIRTLTKKMSEYNIVWNRLSPSPQISKEYYVEQSYSIPFKTSYHNLALFLTDIGQMERIFATRFLSLSPFSDPNDPHFTISGELIFLFYTSKG